MSKKRTMPFFRKNNSPMTIYPKPQFRPRLTQAQAPAPSLYSTRFCLRPYHKIRPDPDPVPVPAQAQASAWSLP